MPRILVSGIWYLASEECNNLYFDVLEVGFYRLSVFIQSNPGNLG